MSDIYHVTPDPKGGWRVMKQGAQRASKHTNTKAEALAAAKELTENQNARMRVHNKDGAFAAKPATQKQTNEKKVAKRAACKAKGAVRNDRKKKAEVKRK
ncbi:MAG: DUF2188 domain-containing protein [Firmicutes bacterium]|nr:DUF2188 domain-containing protein [Bacillota bacterium]